MATTTSILDGGITINEIHPFPNVDHDGDGSTDVDDLYVELYNTSGGAIDISGYEILGFEGGTFGVMHTFDPGTTLAAGDRITVVDSEGGMTGISGVAGTSEFSDNDLLFGDNTNLFLFAPPTVTHPNGSYIVVAGDTASAFFAFDLADFLALHPGATQIGSTETTPASPGSPNANSFQRPLDGEAGFVSQGATPGTANCFLTGTLIATPDGERRVEDLVVGDKILSAAGNVVTVLWNAHQTFRLFQREPVTDPVRIDANALGEGLPHTDLVLSADHAIVVDGMLINASALINGTSIDFVSAAESPGRITYHHIETENHDVILANGVASETFLDMPGRMAFDNFQEYLDLYGAERIIPEMNVPRVTSQRLLPDALKKRLGLAETPVDVLDWRASA